MVTRSRRRLIWWIGGAVVLIAAMALTAPFIYIHFIEGPAPAKLELPTTHASTSAPGGGHLGCFVVRRQRHLECRRRLTGWLPGPRGAVGPERNGRRADQQIWGSLTIGGTSVSKGSFTVDISSVVSDQSQRNAQFDGRIMDVNQYPTATLVLTAPIPLGTLPAAGTTKQYPAQGTLTMHGVSKAVTFTVTAERIGSEIDVLAHLPITFSEWNIANPSIGGFVTTADNGTLEVLLHLTQSAGNAPSTTSGSNTAGGGGPVTVPSTTVPPLTVTSG